MIRRNALMHWRRSCVDFVADYRDKIAQYPKAVTCERCLITFMGQRPGGEPK